MFRFTQFFILCIIIVTSFTACSKLNVFVTEEEAKAALVEVLLKSNEVSYNQNQDLTFMRASTSSTIQFPQLASIQFDLISKMPIGVESYNKLVDNINIESCKLSKELMPIISNAIVNTTYEDVYYLTATNEARATYYLKSKHEQAIRKQINQIVYTQIHGNNLEITYTAFQDSYNFLAGKKVLNQDLTEYLTQEITTRYFVYMAKEEQELRTYPSRQSSSLIKKVFENI